MKKFETAQDLLKEFDPATTEDGIKIENAKFPVTVFDGKDGDTKVIDADGVFVGLLD